VTTFRPVPRRILETLAAAAILAASAALAAAERPLQPSSTETRVVPALADPGLVPGVGRCTSDGRCTVTDGGGTRVGSRLSVER
jgi:hypothetical protein